MSGYNETKKEGVRVSYYKSLVAARHWRRRGEWAMALEVARVWIWRISLRTETVRV